MKKRNKSYAYILTKKGKYRKVYSNVKMGSPGSKEAS